MSTEKRRDFVINTVYFLICIGLGYIALKYLFSFLAPFLIGFLVAFILQRGINFVSGKLRIPKKIVAIIFVVLFYTIIGLLLFLVGFGLFAGLKDLIERLPQIYTNDIEPIIKSGFDTIENFMVRYDLTFLQIIEDLHVSLSQSIGKIVSDVSAKMISAITTMVTFVPGIFLAIILAVISSVFFVVDYNNITQFIVNQLPERYINGLVKLKNFAGKTGLKYIKAYILLMLITFSELAVGLSILQVERALTIAALVAFIDFLPVFGTGLVIIPWSILAFIKGDITMGIGLAVLYVIIAIVRNTLEPRLIGKQIGVHPLVMLISMYIGARTLGFIGLLFFPIIVIVAKFYYDNSKFRFNSRS